MTKAHKKKVIVKVHPGEAVFVASIDILEHISSTYLYMAETAPSREEADSWRDVAMQVQDWANKTYYSGEYTNDEEW
jgi:hypothetical protein